MRSPLPLSLLSASEASAATSYQGTFEWPDQELLALTSTVSTPVITSDPPCAELSVSLAVKRHGEASVQPVVETKRLADTSPGRLIIGSSQYPVAEQTLGRCHKNDRTTRVAN